MLIFFVLKILSTFAQEGYPKPGAVIEPDVKNNFCFPIVISVNEKIIQLKPKEEISLGSTKWSDWNWLPGKLSEQTNLTLFHPLKNKRPFDFGPNSKTHQDKFAYDFNAPEGTEVFSMNDGVVAKVIQNFSNSHQHKDKDEGNHIEVVHDDGTVARYYHLKKDSAKVSLCQKVKKGDVIAETGNTGFSEGPHLHVEVFRPLDGKNFKTIELKFE